MKKVLCLSICLLLMCTVFISPVNAEEDISVTLNGAAISFDRQPVMQNDRVLVPLRAVFEALGADVYWAEEPQIAGIIKNDIKVLAMVGENDMVKCTCKNFEEFMMAMFDETNIEEIYSDVVMQIIDDAVYIPVRIISEALGVSVDWDDDTSTVILQCEQSFIDQANEDETFMDEFIAFISSDGQPRPYNYTDVAASKYVPDGVKELCRIICDMTDAAEVYEKIVNMYGEPSGDWSDSESLNSVWDAEDGEIFLSSDYGAAYVNGNGLIWNLMPVHSKFSEVFEPTLDLSDYITSVDMGTVLLNSDGGYRFILPDELDQDSFFSENPVGVWEIKFEKDYGYETDINTAIEYDFIAKISFTGEGGDSASLYMWKNYYLGLEFDSNELGCYIEPHAIKSPFAKG